MTLYQIQQLTLGLNNDELRDLNSFILDRSKQLGRNKKREFTVGQKITCDGDIFTISKLNRSKAKCVKDGTTQMWNIPFSRMTALEGTFSA